MCASSYRRVWPPNSETQCLGGWLLWDGLVASAFWQHLQVRLGALAMETRGAMLQRADYGAAPTHSKAFGCIALCPPPLLEPKHSPAEAVCRIPAVGHHSHNMPRPPSPTNAPEPQSASPLTTCLQGNRIFPLTSVRAMAFSDLGYCEANRT